MQKKSESILFYLTRFTSSGKSTNSFMRTFDFFKEPLPVLYTLNSIQQVPQIITGQGQVNAEEGHCICIGLEGLDIQKQMDVFKEIIDLCKSIDKVYVNIHANSGVESPGRKRAMQNKIAFESLGIDERHIQLLPKEKIAKDLNTLCDAISKEDVEGYISDVFNEIGMKSLKTIGEDLVDGLEMKVIDDTGLIEMNNKVEEYLADQYTEEVKNKARKILECLVAFRKKKENNYSDAFEALRNDLIS